MQTRQSATVSLPFPSRWAIHADIAGRPVVWGTFMINSVIGDRVEGTVNFRGRPIPIHGTWNETTKQIAFDSPYAAYSGQLSILDNPSIQVRHFTLSGRLMMKPPSVLAGSQGTWVATTNVSLSPGEAMPYQQPGHLPPVGAFTTSNLLYQRRPR